MVPGICSGVSSCQACLNLDPGESAISVSLKSVSSIQRDRLAICDGQIVSRIVRLIIRVLQRFRQSALETRSERDHVFMFIQWTWGVCQ